MHRDYNCFTGLERHACWSARYYQIVESARHVRSFRLADVAIERLTGVPEEVFWDPSTHKKGRAVPVLDEDPPEVNADLVLAIGDEDYHLFLITFFLQSSNPPPCG